MPRPQAFVMLSLSTLIVVVAACSAGAQPPVENDDFPAALTLSGQMGNELERVFVSVLTNRNKVLLPYFRNYVRRDVDDTFHTLDIRVQLLGRCKTINGERLLALVRFKASGQDGDGHFATGSDFLAYFSPDMRIADHHGIGCGKVSLAGDAIHVGTRRFDLSTKEGLAALRKTADWC